MNHEFSYTHKDGRVMIRAAHMDIEEMAAEIGYLTHNIYSTLMRQSPPTARLFRELMLVAIAGPDTPTWDASPAQPGRVEVVVAKPREGQV